MAGSISAAILAGGKSSRMGTNKAFVPLNGKPLIEHVLERLQQVNPAEILIIANHPDLYTYLDIPVQPDLIRDNGPLAGIYTALQTAHQNNVLVVACDMPFINPQLLTYIIDIQLAAPQPYDAIVPRLQGTPQGLHALYHKTCTSTVRRFIDSDQLKLTDVLSVLNVRFIDEPEYLPLGVEVRSFINLNTPEELRQAKEHLG